MQSIERVAQTSPLACYGLEYLLLPDRCGKCLVEKDCRKASASREGLVPLPKAVVHLFGRASNDQRLAASEFHLYHRVLLRRPPSGGLMADQISKVIELAHGLGVRSSALIMATLLNHRLVHPELRAPFHAQMLTGDHAANCLKVYREECAVKSATFDCGVLGEIYGIPAEHNIFLRLKNSEAIACSYGVESNLSQASSGLNYLYDMYELKLDPWWLATERSYLNWIVNGEDGTSRLKVRDHRRRTRKSIGSPALQAVISVRETLAIECAMAAARKAKLNTDHVLIPPVIDLASKLWKALAYAQATRDTLNILG